MSILLCVGYAISDEIHQLFVDGRAGSLMDVMIDSMGSVTSVTYLAMKRKKEVNV